MVMSSFGADRAEEGLAELAGSLSSAPLHSRSADVTDWADTQALAELARQTTGRVDVLVNVAGFFRCSLSWQ
jgi:NAD(P)-dependent dehydrogenase (short-subunit alcohol dehydrogenase family)